MAVPKTPGERPTGPKSIQDLLVDIRDIPQARARQQAQQKVEDERRKRREALERRRGALVQLAHEPSVHPEWIIIEKFDE